MYACIHRNMRETQHDEWACFWDSKDEQWLEGYCFARQTIFWDWQYKWSQHVDIDTPIVYVFDEEIEEDMEEE